MDKKSTARIVIVIAGLAIALVAYYTYLVNRVRFAGEEDVKLSPIQEVLERDMVNFYPSTPKEVMKYYSSIIRCYYNEDWTQEELTALAQRARLLYDDELAANNQWTPYMESLQEEIGNFKEKKRRISNFSVGSSTSVDYFSEDGYDFARIRCAYNITENSRNLPVNEVYLLRKDEKGRWRIYGWELAENLKINQE